MRTQLEQIENKTCVKFVPHNTERDYIVIGNYSGCSSLLGRRGGRQKISMSYNRIKKTTCLRGTTMVHEMMHAFGIHHMHNSFDRDNYISVRLENVRPSSHKNFMIVNDSKFLDSPYDLRSATHYGRGSYSNNGNDVIVPHDPSFSLIIGHAKELSAGDITRINRLHSCPSLER